MTPDFRRPIVLAIALSLLLIPAAATAAAAGSACPANGSTARPPDTIRVVVGRSIHRVPFRTYVQKVVAREWGSTPHELRRAGAVAVKQYGWSKALHPRRLNGRCFDVYDSTRDQIYRASARPSLLVLDAVHSTWNMTLRRPDGGLVFTGYRTGRAGVACARDAGERLYARSAKRCANAGWSTERILAVYYADRNARVHQ